MRKKNALFKIVVLLLFIAFFINGCNKDKEDNASVTQPVVPKERIKEEPTEKQVQKKTESDQNIKYEIIKKECVLPFKRALDIRIQNRITDQQLRELALKIKETLSLEEKKAAKIFIAYWLPGMILNAGSWARTDFTPSLEVQIFGITKEQEKVFKPQPADYEGKVIGQWLHNQLQMKCVFLEKKDGLFMQSTYSDGSKGENKLIKKKVKGGIRYYEKDNDSGEYYMINSNGNLEAYDTDGFIETYTFTKLKDQ